MKHFSSFLLSITCALSLSFFGMHAAVVHPEKIDFDPTQVFDRIIEQGDQEQIYNAAHTLLIMESLLECYFAEKLAAPYNMDSVDWDDATTELLDVLEAISEKMSPDVKDAFDVLDAHFASTQPRFNFHDFMQLINIRRGLALAFWEYVGAFEQFKKELASFSVAIDRLDGIAPKSLSQLRTLCVNWQVNNCGQMLVSKITRKLTRDTKYLDTKIIFSEVRSILEFDYMGFVSQFAIIEKQYKKQLGPVANKICRLGLNIKEAAADFFAFYDTVSATFPKLQKNYPTIYMRATYFKSISSTLYKKLYCALNPENQVIKYGALRGQRLPLEIFVINSVLCESGIQQCQTLHQAFVHLIAFKQSFDQLTTIESVPSPQQATQLRKVKGCDLDDVYLMQQRYIEYLSALSHIERENPVISQQINHLALWGQLHAIDLVNCSLLDRMNQQITSTAKYICDYKKANRSWPEDKSKRITILSQIIGSMQRSAGCSIFQFSDLESRISSIVASKISRFFTGSTKELQRPEYNDAYPIFSIPSNRLMPTINYYEQLIRQKFEDLISARDAVQAVPAPQSSREEQIRQVPEPRPHTPKKAPKPKTKKHKEDAAPSPLPAQAISPVDEKQKEAEVSVEAAGVAVPSTQVDDINPVLDEPVSEEYVVYQKPEHCVVPDRPRTKARSPKSAARAEDSTQTLNDYLKTILSQPLFNCDHIKEEDDFIAIRQQHGGLWGNGMMLIIYKEQENQHLACAPFNIFQLAEKQSGDTFHKFSDRVENYVRYGMDLDSEQLVVTPGIHQSFVEKLYLQPNERVIIIRGKIINNRFYRCEQAMQDKNASRPGMHDGAFVYIYNPKTSVCKHRCFHETTASYAANHESH